MSKIFFFYLKSHCCSCQFTLKIRHACRCSALYKTSEPLSCLISLRKEYTQKYAFNHFLKGKLFGKLPMTCFGCFVCKVSGLEYRSESCSESDKLFADSCEKMFMCLEIIKIKGYWLGVE